MGSIHSTKNIVWTTGVFTRSSPFTNEHRPKPFKTRCCTPCPHTAELYYPSRCRQTRRTDAPSFYFLPQSNIIPVLRSFSKRGNRYYPIDTIQVIAATQEPPLLLLLFPPKYYYSKVFLFRYCSASRLEEIDSTIQVIAAKQEPLLFRPHGAQSD
jgi:hypothetical protein